MNNLLTRDFHEAIGDIIKVEMNDDLRLGNSLMNKIPYNQVEEVQDENKRKEENPLQVSEEECRDLVYKIAFNQPETQLKYVENLFIKSKNYMGLYYYYKHNVYPYNRMDNFALYTFCRTICGKGMTQVEHKKIRDDLKSIKKSMDLLKKKAKKKQNGSYNVKF